MYGIVGTADLNSSPVPEQLFDLTQDDRHRIGGETDPAVRVKPIARFDKPQAARRIQFFVFDAAACKAASTGMYKAKVFLDELRAR